MACEKAWINVWCNLLATNSKILTKCPVLSFAGAFKWISSEVDRVTKSSPVIMCIQQFMSAVGFRSVQTQIRLSS